MACGGSFRRKLRGRSPRVIRFKVFYWKHHFPIFLALFGTFWLFPSILVRFQRNSGFKLLFQSYFEPRGRFFSFQVRLFVRLAAGLVLQNSAFFSLSSLLSPSRQTNDKFGNFFFKFSRLHLSTVAKSW